MNKNNNMMEMIYWPFLAMLLTVVCLTSVNIISSQNMISIGAAVICLIGLITCNMEIYRKGCPAVCCTE